MFDMFKCHLYNLIFFAKMFVLVKENEVKSYFGETTLTVNIGQRCGSENWIFEAKWKINHINVTSYH